eukprot:Tamp_27620.p1 GENE.Tamp_27620~~Tamp_27620.p1  ORF type:complete len:104 (+),score=3.38 Tamp_27620:35-346(+)
MSMTGASGRGPVTDLLAGDQSRYCLGFNLNVTLNPGPIRGPGEPRGWHDDDGVYCCQFSRSRQSWAPYTLLGGEEEEEEGFRVALRPSSYKLSSSSSTALAPE